MRKGDNISLQNAGVSRIWNWIFGEILDLARFIRILVARRDSQNRAKILVDILQETYQNLIRLYNCFAKILCVSSHLEIRRDKSK